jgi:hypothetical protein
MNAKIETEDGRVVKATYVRHLRTLTGRGDNTDVDLWRTVHGRLVVCTSPSNDCRVLPVEDSSLSPENAMWIE